MENVEENKKVYRFNVVSSVTAGELLEDGRWQVVTTVTERRKVELEDDWEDINISYGAVADTVQEAQRVASNALMEELISYYKEGYSSMFDFADSIAKLEEKDE